MPIIPPIPCNHLSVTPLDLCISLPGGVEVCAQFPDLGFPDPVEVVRQIFGQLNSALTPLAPVFSIIDVVITLIECVKAIPDGATEIPPFKTLIGECIPQLPSKLAKLLELIPPLSIPLTIVGFIDTIILLIEGFIIQLDRMVNNIARIIAAETRAAELGSAQLNLIVDCANENVEAEIEQFNAHLGPLSSIIALVGIFAGLAGIDLSGVSIGDIGPDPSSALEPLTSTLNTIKQIRSTIPV